MTIKTKPRASKITYGDVTIQASSPSKDVVEANIRRSSEALERFASAIVKPGVSLGRKKGVPRYFADPDDRGIFWRQLNGQLERGRLIDGRFEVVG